MEPLTHKHISLSNCKKHFPLCYHIQDASGGYAKPTGEVIVLGNRNEKPYVHWGGPEFDDF